jgi:hypothetical protein
VIALAPASAVCAAAAVEGGVNIVADIACFAAALNNIANKVCVQPFFGIESGVLT